MQFMFRQWKLLRHHTTKIGEQTAHQQYDTEPPRLSYFDISRGIRG